MYQNKDLQDGVLGGGEEGGKLLEANVTIISNEECKGKEGLDSNKISRQNKQKMLTALPLGLEYGMMCAKGECEDGVCKTSCKVQFSSSPIIIFRSANIHSIIASHLDHDPLTVLYYILIG